MKVAYKLAALLGVFHITAVRAHPGHGPGDCGNPDPTQDDDARARQNEIKTFADLSNIVQNVAASKGKGKRKSLRSLLSAECTLVDVPLVYRVLTGQSKPGSTAGPVRATAAQLEFMTNKTNELFNIYDKASQNSVQWASFVNTETLYHTDSISKDCASLSKKDYDNIIKDVSEWEFKMHVIICESTSWSGVASFPSTYRVNDVKHNMVCFDTSLLHVLLKNDINLIPPFSN